MQPMLAAPLCRPRTKYAVGGSRRRPQCDERCTRLKCALVGAWAPCRWRAARGPLAARLLVDILAQSMGDGGTGVIPLHEVVDWVSARYQVGGARQSA